MLTPSDVCGQMRQHGLTDWKQVLLITLIVAVSLGSTETEAAKWNPAIIISFIFTC